MRCRSYALGVSLQGPTESPHLTERGTIRYRDFKFTKPLTAEFDLEAAEGYCQAMKGFRRDCTWRLLDTTSTETAMWPTCINALTPFPLALQDKPPADLVEAFRQVGWPDVDNTLPIRFVSLLGTCTTDKYQECPNFPDWHIGKGEHLEEIGIYLWCDFDLIDRNGSTTKLRMTFNEGDADCNDGTWGAVWDRDTAEVVANFTSVDDCEGRVEASEKHIESYVPHDLPVPTDSESFVSSLLPCTLVYANDSELEKLLGVAMRWCFFYRLSR